MRLFLLPLLLPLLSLSSPVGVWAQTTETMTPAQPQEQASEADQLFKAGESSYSQSDYSAALENWLAALAAYRQSTNQRGEAITLNRLGRLYTFCGQCGSLTQAFDYLEQSLAVATENGFGRLQGSNLLDMGFVYARRGDHQEAISYYRRALERFEAVEDLIGQDRKSVV